MGTSPLSSGPTLHNSSGQALRTNREGWGTQNPSSNQNPNTNQNPNSNLHSNQNLLTDNRASQATNHDSQITSHSSQATNNDTRITNHDTRQSQNFDPSAYASFERSTNDVVARDVRAAVTDT